MADALKNFAYSLVATAPSPASSGLSLTVGTGEGSRFPPVPFNATIWPTAANPLPTNAEIIRVTAIAGDALTIVRAQEGSSARTVVIGDQIAATETAQFLGLGLVNVTPSYGLSIPPNHSVVVSGPYRVNDGVTVRISDGARLRAI